MIDKLGIEDLEAQRKKVLVRVDFNVPLDKNATITDDTRIVASLPSIRYLLDQGAAVILMSHLGRPKGEKQQGLSLRPCAERLSELLGQPVQMADDCIGKSTAEAAARLQPGEVLLLENLRFHTAEEKPESDPSFAKQLAELGDCYVNDAFGTAHRAHSSTALIAEYFPGQAAAGYLLGKEIQFLDQTLRSPDRPLYAILGGAKVSSKLGVVHALLDKVDGLVIGGAMAFTFLKAQGYQIGRSLCEDELIDQAKAIIAKCESKGIRLLLPVDIIAAESISEMARSETISMKAGVPDRLQGLDVGPETIAAIEKELSRAKTVLWNGPLGVFEIKQFARGTLAIAKCLAKADALTVVGGGDSVAAIKSSGLEKEFTHLSTGGGAALEYLEYGKLPGISALSDRQRQRQGNAS